MNPSPALVADTPLPSATTYLTEPASAPGADGRRIQPGDRVGCEVREGFWVPASILHLERSEHGQPMASLLIAAPGLPSIDTVPVDRCIRLVTRRRSHRQRLS